LVCKEWGVGVNEIGELEYRGVDRIWGIGEGVYGVTSRAMNYTYVIQMKSVNGKNVDSKVKMSGLQEAKYTICFRGNLNQFIQVCSDCLAFSESGVVPLTEHIIYAGFYKQYIILCSIDTVLLYSSSTHLSTKFFEEEILSLSFSNSIYILSSRMIYKYEISDSDLILLESIPSSSTYYFKDSSLSLSSYSTFTTLCSCHTSLNLSFPILYTKQIQQTATEATYFLRGIDFCYLFKVKKQEQKIGKLVEYVNDICSLYGDIFILACRNVVKIGNLKEKEDRRSIKLGKGAIEIEADRSKVMVGYRDKVEVYDRMSLEKENEIGLDKNYEILTIALRRNIMYLGVKEEHRCKFFGIHVEKGHIVIEKVFDSYILNIGIFEPFVLLRFTDAIVIYNSVNDSYLPPIHFDTPFYSEIKQKLSEEVLQFIGDGDILTRYQPILDAYILSPAPFLDLNDSMTSLSLVCLTETNLYLIQQHFSGSIDLLFTRSHDALSLLSPSHFITNYHNNPEILSFSGRRYSITHTIKKSYNLALNRGFVDWRNHGLEIREISNYLTS
jgi:hypothetical protein